MVDEIPHEPRVKHIKREYFHPWVSPNVVVADLTHLVRFVLIENRLGLRLVFSAGHYAIEFIHLLKKVVLEWRAEVIHRDVLKNISRFIEFVLGDQVSRTLNQELLSYHRHDGKRHAYRSNQSVPPILDIIVHIYILFSVPSTPIWCMDDPCRLWLESIGPLESSKKCHLSVRKILKVELKNS